MARWNNSTQTDEEVNRLKREAVLRESGRLFSRHGYHNTSLESIAAALGVSKATLYNYVRDKQEILFTFHNMAMSIGERAADAAEQSGLNGAGKIKFSIVTYIADVSAELGGYGVIAEIGALRPADRKIVVDRRHKLDRRFIRMVEEGIADGSLRSVDPGMAVFTVLGALQLVPNWFSPDGRLTGREVAEATADILVYGMAVQVPVDMSAAPDQPSDSLLTVHKRAKKSLKARK